MKTESLVVAVLSVFAMSGCESPKWSQIKPSTDVKQTTLIPSATSTPVRTAEKSRSIGPAFDQHDSALISAVQKRWEKLLKEWHGSEPAGQVVVEFSLHADGSISDVAVAKSTLGLELTRLSQTVITGAAPFPPWPEQMKRMVGDDFREITFTFRYY